MRLGEIVNRNYLSEFFYVYCNRKKIDDIMEREMILKFNYYFN